MTLIDFGSGWYINSRNINYIFPNNSKYKQGVTGISFEKGDSLYLNNTPSEVVAIINAAGTPLEDSVNKLILLNQSTQKTLSETNARILELTDRLQLLDAEFKAYKAMYSIPAEVKATRAT